MDSFISNCTPFGSFVDPLISLQWYNKLIIKGQKHRAENMLRKESTEQCHYLIFDEDDTPLFSCEQKNDTFCGGFCFLSGRTFCSNHVATFNIVDPDSEMKIVILRVEAAYCGQPVVVVEAPAGTTIATIHAKGVFLPKVCIRDARGATLLYLESNTKSSCGASDFSFSIKDPIGTVVALITRHSGRSTCCGTSRSNFTVDFHGPLNNQIRAVVLACVFFIAHWFVDG